MTDVLVLLVVLLLTGAAAAWYRSHQGRVTAVEGATFDRGRLGAPVGATLLVEFTAPGCVPCGQAREVLETVARDRPDVAVVLADVGDHLDLARAHGILRAPTTLLVDPEGRVCHRISGVPAGADVTALLDGRRVQAA
jgi:thioredoxin-like negative regulator of GroEL